VSGEETAGAANFILSQAFTSGTSNTPATYSQSVDAKGAFGGLQFGYRSRLSQLLVAGLEVDFQGASISGDGSTTGTAVVGTATMSTEQELKWFGTVRGQLGFLLSPQLMVFGSGGLAYGRTEITGILSTTAISSVSSGSTIFGGCAGGGAPCLKGSDSQVSVGWTAGGCVEWALQGNATFRIEYLHVDLGEQTARLTAPTGNAFIQTKIDNSYDLVRGAISFKLP
jgi:outer membrane immunogenic protein